MPSDIYAAEEPAIGCRVAAHASLQRHTHTQSQRTSAENFMSDTCYCSQIIFCCCCCSRFLLPCDSVFECRRQKRQVYGQIEIVYTHLIGKIIAQNNIMVVAQQPFSPILGMHARASERRARSRPILHYSRLSSFCFFLLFIIIIIHLYMQVYNVYTYIKAIYKYICCSGKTNCPLFVRTLSHSPHFLFVFQRKNESHRRIENGLGQPRNERVSCSVYILLPYHAFESFMPINYYRVEEKGN